MRISDWSSDVCSSDLLDVHVAPGDLLADLIDAVLGAVAPGDDDAIAVLAVLRLGQLGSDAQQRRQHRARDDALPVPVHVVFQAGVAGWVGAHAVVERPDRKSPRLNSSPYRGFRMPSSA